MDDGDIDALFLCCGLGGSMAFVAPDLASFLKKSLLEPLFGICTLPRRSEGDICLAHAADQLDSLLEVLDGIIIFDNEAWSEKIPATIAPEPEKEIDVIAGRLLEKIRPEIPKNQSMPSTKAWILLSQEEWCYCSVPANTLSAAQMTPRKSYSTLARS